MEKIKYAVVGIGHIAQNAVLPAFKNATKNSQLVALVSGDLEKAQQVAQKYPEAEVLSYDDYEQLLESQKIDAVYISLPNHLHTEFALKAIERNIHVLCEKPLATNEDDIQKLMEASKDHQVKLMTAYRLHLEPANLAAIETCQSGELGDLKYISANFSFRVEDKDNIRLKKETGGGPIWDIGIYCINATRYLFAEEPELVFAMAKSGQDEEGFSEVHEGLSAVMQFTSGKLATFNISFNADSVANYEVCGREGSLRLEKAFSYNVESELLITKGDSTKNQKFPPSDQFGPELIYFSDCIIHNRTPEPGPLEALADTKVILALLESIESQKAVAIKQMPQLKQRPNISMEKKAPKIDPPKEVGSQSPKQAG